MTILEKICFYLGLGFGLVLLLMILFSKNGVMDYRQLKEKEARLSAKAALQEQKNRKLEKEIISLKQDIEYIKHLAKHEHGMAETGELIFKDKGENTSSD